MIPTTFNKTEVSNVFTARRNDFYYFLFILISLNDFLDIAKKIQKDSKYFGSKSEKISRNLDISNIPGEAFCIRIEFNNYEQAYLFNLLLKEENYYVQQ